MITKIRIRGYRIFRDLLFEPEAGRNILVGDNQSGKSTILEAISLALTNRVNGHPAQEELNPFWFNQDMVREFFENREAGKNPPYPTITIEVQLVDEDDLQRLRGAHNLEPVTTDCPGMRIIVEPDPERIHDLEAHLTKGTTLVPTEFYRVDWRSFADSYLLNKPKAVSLAVIDSRTIRSTSGIDYHLRQMLSDHLEDEDRIKVAIAYRSVKESMTKEHLKGVNEKMAKLQGPLSGEKLALAMDHSSRTSWDTSVTPHVDDIPFSMTGQGQQASVKIALAMGRSSESARIVMIEEPENHLSHSSLNKLINSIEKLTNETQQVFITTHSSYVLNRLGLSQLRFVSRSDVYAFHGISQETVSYFKRLPGYDTLRLVLASRAILVEGPADEIVVDRFYSDKYGKRPIEDGIELISVRGLSHKRFLELAKLLKKRCAAIRDLDKKTREALVADYGDLIENAQRQLFTGDVGYGSTLEPQIVSSNSEEVLRSVLGLSDEEIGSWMTANKTEAAIRIAESNVSLTPPSYLRDAIEFAHG